MNNYLFNFDSKSKKIILVDEDENLITEKEMVKKINMISKYIIDHSVIVLIADNCFEFIAGYVASVNNKKTISIILDKSFSKTYMEKIIRKFKPNYIYSPKTIFFDNLRFKEINEFKKFKILKLNFNHERKINNKNFILLSTSGTTESPKFVRLSKKNIEDNTSKIINYLKIKKTHRTITTMPAGYSYGLSILNSHLKSGAKIILNNSSVIEKIFWNKINKFKVSSFGGVPELYEFLKRIDFKKYVSKNLKYLSQAGGKMDERTLRYFGNICKINKIKFYVMYGQTEESPRISYLEWKYFFSKINSIGKTLKGYKLKIIKKNKEIKKPNITGEIVLYGDSVCLGYAKNLNDLKKGDVNKKVLYTGDLGFRDKEGFIYLSGRSKKIVKIFGKRYDLLEIENYLKKSNIKAKCRLEDKKISIDVIDLSIKEKIIDIIFNKFQLNKNFISVNLKKSKNFKEYY